MQFPTTNIQTLTVEPNRRILAVSDIHGYGGLLRKLLEQAHFCPEDLLVIVGDIVEKGPESLTTLRYVMELCKQGNAIALIGNVDAGRMEMIETLSEDNAEKFYRYLLSLRVWVGTSFYDELAMECGYEIESAADVLRAKEAIIRHFQPEFSFLASLPTIVETQNYVFVHGGLREREVAANLSCGLFELTKYDAFMTKTPHTFDKYLVVGHWPVALYDGDKQQLNPIVNREKKIIAIDGCCGVQKECQLNLLVIPAIDCAIDEVSHLHADAFPRIRALESQEESENPVHIFWTDREIKMLERGDEVSLVEHVSSGRKVHVPNVYLKSDTECHNYTSYVLPVEAGETLALIRTVGERCMVKKNGVVGWYGGAYEEIR